MLISFKTLWFGTLLGASFPGAPAVFAVICKGFAVFCAVLCGAERLSGGSKAGGAPLAIVLLN